MTSSDLGEQAISKAAELGIKSKLDEAEELDVDISANPLDLMQGEVDSVSVEGEGLVMKKELRAEKLKIETNSISIDSMKAAMGNIELTRTTDSKMLVVLKEKDLQNAFNSKYIKNKLQNLEIDYQGEKLNHKIDRVEFKLLDGGKIGLNANVYLIEPDNHERISLTAIPQIDDAGHCIRLTSVEYAEDTYSEKEVAKGIIDSTEEILDLRNFDLNKMSLRVRKLDIRKGKLTLEADAEIKDFPEQNS